MRSNFGDELVLRMKLLIEGVRKSTPYRSISFTADNLDPQFLLQRDAPEHWGCETVLRILILPRIPMPNRKNNKQMFLSIVYALLSLHWLPHTVSAYSEPAGATTIAVGVPILQTASV
ncbi:hypothetical protein TNCV_3437011 [Trichonephila clavipes]|nr:hypothetical protein TNCV_3437011 [Trichonephila clavipes]